MDRITHKVCSFVNCCFLSPGQLSHAVLPNILPSNFKRCTPSPQRTQDSRTHEGPTEDWPLSPVKKTPTTKVTWPPQPIEVVLVEMIWETRQPPRLSSLANAFLPASSGAMTKGKEQSLVMSLSISWPLRVLVISAVLQQGMTAMRMQTPGCPVTGPYHPDDEKEKWTARVFVSVAPGFYFGQCVVMTEDVSKTV